MDLTCREFPLASHASGRGLRWSPQTEPAFSLRLGSSALGSDGFTQSVARLARHFQARSEEHTSELQSHHDLVCRLLLEKKKNKNKQRHEINHDKYICRDA